MNQINQANRKISQAERDVKQVNALVNKLDFTKEKGGSSSESQNRKAESKFITSLISRIGNSGINCDYTGYIELDNFACWVIADGIDDVKGSEEASRKCVEVIIENFITKPKFSREYAKKLLEKAHLAIKNMQKTKGKKIGIGASVTFILTDYTSVILASVGNTRGMLLRDEFVYKKTRDHNIAYLMYENKTIDYDSIRYSNQKDKLTQYVGDYGNLRPYISGKIKLTEGDKLLLLSSGAWEYLDEKDIEITLSQAERVGKWVGSMEKLIQSSEGKKLNNHSIIGIFIDKTATQGGKIRKIGSKFIILIPFLLIAFFLIWKGYSIKHERNKVYDEIYRYEAEADRNLNSKMYYKALENLKKSKAKYNELYVNSKSGFFTNTIFTPKILNRNIDNQVGNLDRKITDLETVIKLEKIKEKAESDYKNNNFQEALKEYQEIAVLLGQVETLNIEDKEAWKKEINSKIEACEGLKVGMEQKEKADGLAEDGLTDEAIRNYLEAKLIFLKYNKVDLLAEVTNKAETLTKKRDKIYKQALEFEKNGIKNENKNVTDAITYYEMARNAYEELNDMDKVDEMDQKLSELEEMKATLKEERNAYMRNAKLYSKEGKYEKALSTIKKAQDTSNILKDNQGMADSLEKEGDILLENGKYELAVDTYKDAYNYSVNTNNRVQQRELEMKQNMSKILTKGKELEDQGDELFKTKKYKDSKLKFREAKKEYEKVKGSEYISTKQYDRIISEVSKKEKAAWRESNWIPFF